MGTWVYTCDQPTQQSERQVTLSTEFYGTCTGGAANGYWKEIQDDYWWETKVDGEAFADLLAMTALCLGVAFAIRMVSDSIRGKK